MKGAKRCPSVLLSLFSLAACVLATSATIDWAAQPSAGRWPIWLEPGPDGPWRQGYRAWGLLVEEYAPIHGQIVVGLNWPIPLAIALALAYLPLRWARYQWGWLRQLRQTRRLGRGECPKCGYDLRAHAPGQVCPECGTAVPGDLVRRPMDSEL